MTKRDRRRGIRPIGVAQRLTNAPASGYRYGKARPLHWCKTCDRYYSEPCSRHD